MNGLRFGLTISGKPQGYERHRVGKGRIYTPPEYREYVAYIRAMAVQQAIREHEAHPYKSEIFGRQPVGLVAVYYVKDKRHADRDNYTKALQDGLQTGKERGKLAPGILHNDKQIVQAYSAVAIGEPERTELTAVSLMGGDPWELLKELCSQLDSSAGMR